MKPSSRRFGAFALLLTAYVASVPPARGADTFQPGTYRQVSPATGRLMSVGNEVVLQADRHGHLRFSLNAIRPSDNNLGYIAGTLPRDAGTIVWSSTKEYARCRLTFAPVAGAFLRLTQDVRFGDCGFGYGVLGDGLYKRTRAGGKLGAWNGP
jgi:hypothetical protein